MRSEQGKEIGRAEAFVVHLDSVTDRPAIGIRRQQIEKSREVIRIKLLRWQELPVYRAELVLQLHDAAGEKPLDRRASFGELAPVRREPRTLYGKDEIVGSFVMPLGKALRLLRAVVGTVDLDRCQLAACVFELAAMGQVGRIEGAAPGFEYPSPNPDSDFPLFLRHDRCLRRAVSLPLLHRVGWAIIPENGSCTFRYFRFLTPNCTAGRSLFCRNNS